MKPIIKQTQQDTILTSEITDRHLVVAIIYDKPRILGKGFAQGNGALSFFNMADEMSSGNGMQISAEEDTPQKMVEYAIHRGWPVAVYHQSDWKAALQWLIDNA